MLYKINSLLLVLSISAWTQEMGLITVSDKGWPGRETIGPAIEERDLNGHLAKLNKTAFLTLSIADEMVTFEARILSAHDKTSKLPTIDISGSTYTVSHMVSYRKKKTKPETDDAIIRSLIDELIFSMNN